MDLQELISALDTISTKQENNEYETLEAFLDDYTTVKEQITAFLESEDTSQEDKDELISALEEFEKKWGLDSVREETDTDLDEEIDFPDDEEESNDDE